MATWTPTSKSSDATFTPLSRAVSFGVGDITPGLIATYLYSSGLNVIAPLLKSSEPTFTNLTKN